MFGTEVFIIDPENEYQRMAEAVGGAYVRLSLNSTTRINPFDLPQVVDGEEADNALRSNLITLHGLLRLMMGGAQAQIAGQQGAMIAPALSPVEESDLDQALIETYAKVGITNDPLTHKSQPPTIGDLYDTLLHMGGTGPQLAQRLRKYTTGTFAGIFSQQSNVNINNPLVVFNIRDLEDELRPVAMYIVLNSIWNKTKSDQKKRLLVVDEAWQLMKYEDSANFMFSLAKRARKYNLGITTITQDVEDFMGSRMGRAIVANSSMQLLLKQSASAVDVLSEVFKLTSEEKKRLSQFPVGQGLFFAGQNHVHIQIVPSQTEASLITTNPEQVKQLEQQQQNQQENQENQENQDQQNQENQQEKESDKDQNGQQSPPEQEDENKDVKNQNNVNSGKPQDMEQKQIERMLKRIEEEDKKVQRAPDAHSFRGRNRVRQVVTVVGRFLQTMAHRKRHVRASFICSSSRIRREH